MTGRERAFQWPLVDGAQPTWTGAGFDVRGQARAVLEYDAGDSAWSDDLTRFHEETAGNGVHPIDVASRRRARRALKRWLRVPPQAATLIEVGCSSGFLLDELARDWPDSLVIGSDFISGPLQRLAARMPRLPLLRFDLVACPLPSASVDAVVLLNVLEHIEDDAAAVRQVARILKPGGIAVIEVPAGPWLYDVYDKHLGHFRRYRLSALARLLRDAGLRPLEQSHLGCLVYPAFALVKRRQRRWLAAPEALQREMVEKNIRNSESSLLRWTTALDERFADWIRYPLGIRCVIVASNVFDATGRAGKPS